MTHLSDSITIRNMTLPNRLVMPPMATDDVIPIHQERVKVYDQATFRGI